jgi:hypothetical protein
MAVSTHLDRTYTHGHHGSLDVTSRDQPGTVAIRTMSMYRGALGMTALVRMQVWQVSCIIHRGLSLDDTQTFQHGSRRLAKYALGA